MTVALRSQNYEVKNNINNNWTKTKSLVGVNLCSFIIYKYKVSQLRRDESMSGQRLILFFVGYNSNIAYKK